VSSSLCSLSSVTLCGEIAARDVAIVASENLTSHADIRVEENALLAALTGDLTLESQTERAYSGQSYADRISLQARVHTDGLLVLLAGGDMNFIGAETRSRIGTHIEALANLMDVPVDLAQRRIEQYASKRKRRTVVTDTLHQHVSSHESAGDMRVLVGGSADLAAPQLKGKRLELKAGGSLNIPAVHDLHEQSISERKKGGWFSNSKSSQGLVASAKSRGAEFDFAEEISIDAEKGVSLTQPKIRTPHASIRTQGPVQLKQGRNTSSSSHQCSSSSIFWQKRIDSAESHETCSPPEISGILDISSNQTIAELVKGHTNDFLEHIRQVEGPLTLEHLEEAHQHIRRKIQGPSASLSALVVLAVGIATAGCGTQFAVGTLGLTEGSIAATSVSAGVNSCASQLALGTLNNGGNIGKAVASLCSSDGLKSVASSMLCAGLTQGLGAELGLPQKANGFVQHAQKNALKAGVRCAVSASLGQEDLSSALQCGLSNAFADTIAAYAAEQIGSAFYQQKLDKVSHKLAHGVVAAGLGAALKPEDPIRGATSAALSAITAEFIAEAIIGDRETLKEKGHQHTPQSPSAALQDELHQAADWARIGAALTTLLAGQDVQVGIAAADNALDHNFLGYQLASSISEKVCRSLDPVLAMAAEVTGDEVVEYARAIVSGVAKGLINTAETFLYPIDNVVIPIAELAYDSLVISAKETPDSLLYLHPNPEIDLVRQAIQANPKIYQDAYDRMQKRVDTIFQTVDYLKNASGAERAEAAASVVTCAYLTGKVSSSAVNAVKNYKSFGKPFVRKFHTERDGFVNFDTHVCKLSAQEIKDLNSAYLMYVINHERKLIVTHQIYDHSLLGQAKPVYAAGDIWFSNGKITLFNNRSGSYLPEGPHLQKLARDSLERFGIGGLEGLYEDHALAVAAFRSGPADKPTISHLYPPSITGMAAGAEITASTPKQQRQSSILNFNQKENEKFRDATRGLTKDQKRRIHDKISGEDLTYHEIREIAEEMFEE